jgi:HEAT repeat protein/thioredoxin-related protein
MPCCSRIQILAAFAVALASSCAGPVFSAESTNARPTIHAGLKAATEAALVDQSLVLLIFGAEWCLPCQALKKNTLASPDFLQGGGALRVTEVDIDADEATASRFGVSSVPTMFLLTGDGKIVSRRGGYLDPAGMLAWLAEGRRRAASGLWEGSAPGIRLDSFLTKAAGPGLGSNDLVQLTSMLGESEPGERTGAERLLLAQREKAVPVLIAALQDPYLGQRIGASDALQRLIPDAPSIDPWLPLAELSGPVEKLRQWWSKTGRLPPFRSIPTNDAVALGSIQAALDAIRSDDPIRRTDAMSTLTRHGPPALPLVREAIKRSERTDPRTAAFLEDIRWTILVSDALERRTGGVRSTLARGGSAERQAAATKLGRAGREGIEALGELANDLDPLVVESAVRALSGVGGQDVLPALAALLKASDSNVRMTAAQALGRTRTALATPHLLTALTDPNEVVACAAVSALVEVNANDSPFNPSPGAKEELNSETINALQNTLGDPRWRVRAAGVEAVGKLKLTNLTASILKLLDDPDGFVVKNTLVALAGLEHKPDPARLMAVAGRLPALQGDAISMVAKEPDSKTVQDVLKLFQRGSPSSQSAILAALGRRERFGSQPLDDDWKPVLTSAVTIPDRNVREQLATLLHIAPPALAAEIVGPLIRDDDALVRDEASVIALGILSGTGSAPSGSTGLEEEVIISYGGRRTASAKTNEPPAKPEQIAAWHAALAQRPPSDLSPVATALLFVTGDSNRELPKLVDAVTRAPSRDIEKLASSAALIAIAPRLAWPSSKPLLEQFEQWPALYVQAAAAHSKMPAGAADYLLDPVRFRKTLETASADVLKGALARLLPIGSGQRQAWSLQDRTDRTRRIAAALAESTNAAWRAVSIYLRGRADGLAGQDSYFLALKDGNPWVRAAAAQALANAGLNRAALEQHIGPLVADENSDVAGLAAVALLEPDLRRAAGYQWQFGYFTYEDLHAGSFDADDSSDEGLPIILTNRPSYLEHARRQLSRGDPGEGESFVLLLAQHGDFAELGKALAAEPDSKRKNYASEALLTAINMSQDPQYLSPIRSRLKQTSSPWDLRRLLKAIKGIPGPEARALRLDINRRLRSPDRPDE